MNKIHLSKSYVCEYCGDEFVRSPGSNDAHRYCSRRCAAFAHPKIGKKQCVCEWCNKSFETYPSRPGRFCSRKCSSEYGSKLPRGHVFKPERGGKIYWTCKQCGKEMRTFKSRVRVFCSTVCWGKYNLGKPMNYTGSSVFHQGYRGANWAAQRSAARKRDNNTCQVCGTYSIVVHHIKKYSSFNGDYISANQLSNLIVLCRKHHIKIERGVMDCPKPKS